MKHTLIAQDSKALGYIKQGVDLIYEAVRRTLGPEAGTTLMYRTYNRGPRNVDDGFYTAEVITPKNPFVKLASEFFKEATMRTNRKVGDGTSATTVIAGVLFNEIYNKLAQKAQGYGNSMANGVMAMKRLILSEAEVVKKQITAASTPIENVDDLKKIAAISLGDESEVSNKIAEMAYKVGKEGFIDVVEGYKGEIEYELVEGMRFYAKTCGKAFLNNPARHEMVIEDCPVLVTNMTIDNDVLLRYIIGERLKSLKICIVAEDFSEQILVNMVMARQNGTFIWPVKAKSLRTEQLNDIAIYCGAKLFDKQKGDKLQSISENDLGSFKRLIVKDVEAREDAVLLGGKGTNPETFTKKVEGQTVSVASTPIDEHITVLKGQLEEEREQGLKTLLERRIASMASAGGVIRVGSPTDAETLPLKLKIEDVVYACKAALRNGYVKGGGLCLKEIADQLPQDHILRTALLAPYAQIQENAGGIEIGENVIDPSEAVFFAVEHATSVVASLITVKNLIPEAAEIEAGEGEIALAKSVEKYVLFWAKKEGLLTEAEKQALLDARGGLSQADMLTIDNG